jgi:hypothetical protein
LLSFTLSQTTRIYWFSEDPSDLLNQDFIERCLRRCLAKIPATRVEPSHETSCVNYTTQNGQRLA